MYSLVYFANGQVHGKRFELDDPNGECKHAYNKLLKSRVRFVLAKRDPYDPLEYKGYNDFFKGTRIKIDDIRSEKIKTIIQTYVNSCAEDAEEYMRKNEFSYDVTFNGSYYVVYADWGEDQWENCYFTFLIVSSDGETSFGF